MYMPHDISPVELACACTTLRKAARSLSRLYDDALAPLGMTVAQFGVLKAILREPGLPLSRLADEMVMDRTSLYRSLTPMVKNGWIDIDAAKKGRAKNVTLTARGRRLVDEAKVLWGDVQLRVVGAYGVRHWEALESAISELTRVGVSLAA
ncbi:MAG: MarR family transcriptional regulator [Luteibacter sp.]